jgi:small-conductance mechanosensitive channel
MPRSNPTSDRPAGSNVGSAVLVIALLILLALVGVGLYLLVLRYALLPTSADSYLRVALIIGLSFAAVLVVGRIVRAVATRYTGPRHAGLISDVYRILAYTVLVLVILYAVGVNGYALLAGGTFAGLVIGLASQTALANFVAGVVIVLSRPFEPGDRLTLTTSQYSFLLPSYPPKFYSQDLLLPGFTGSIVDIGLMYTVMRLDDGTVAKFPNSIVIVGAVISHNLRERWVRVKYDVPGSVDPVQALAHVRQAVAADDWVVGKDSVKVQVNQATAASYLISVDALCAGNHEEPPRSALYIRIMRAVRELAPPPPSPGETGRPPPPPAQPPTGPPPSIPGSGEASRI